MKVIETNKAKNIRVLVVDDQRAARMLVRSTLTALGCTKIAECADGRDALSYLAAHRVDLIISDLNMPNMDGFGLLRALRQSGENKQTPFIMLTSHGSLAAVKDAVTLGASEYVVKPFDPTTMKSKIEALLGPLT